MTRYMLRVPPRLESSKKKAGLHANTGLINGVPAYDMSSLKKMAASNNKYG